jgi:geranylgeranyl diphosphate synthase type II
MKSLNELSEIIEKTISTTNLYKFPKELYIPIDYTLSNGGKRLRPLLCLISCDIFDGEVEDAINPAIGIEIFHNFTLVHDDIMDNSPFRRGKPTVFKKWDSNIAILSGDTMFVLAYEYVVKTKDKYLRRILEVFNTTSREVCEGQQYDMNFEIADNISINDYVNMIRLKTAVLIAASMKIGAIVAGAKDEDIERIYSFGEKVGVAFQIKDDYLDTFGDIKKFGKRIGNDILTNKKTYLYLKAFEDANPNQKLRLQKAFEIKNNEQKIDEVIAIYKELEIDKKTDKVINDYYNSAIHNVNLLNIDEERKTFLRDFSLNLINRSK